MIVPAATATRIITRRLLFASFALSTKAMSTTMPSSMTITPSSFWIDICSQLAPLTSVVVFLAPLPTIREMSLKQHTNNMPLLPYSTMVTSCTAWTTYGFLLNETKIWTSNLSGLMLGLYYMTQFIRITAATTTVGGTKNKNTTTKEHDNVVVQSSLPGMISQHIQVSLALCSLILVVALSLPRRQAASYVGRMAVLLYILLSASPLSTIKLVLSSRDASSIPLPFTLTTILNCFLWSIFGFCNLKDINVYLPSMLGLVSGLAQFGLKLRFGKSQQQQQQQPIISLPV